MKQHVLLVEDEPALSMAMQSKLEQTGYIVTLVIDGQAAKERLMNQQFDIVLLDIVMPKIDGFEVLKWLRSQPQLESLPVIITSNLGQNSEIHTGLQLGANDYLIKANLDIDELVSKISQYLLH